MRIVPSLKEVKKCLNCGSDNLHNCRNDKGTEYIFCGYCHEYVYENETTCDGTVTIKIKTPEELFEEKKKKKEQFIFDLREEVNYLSWNSHDARSMVLVNNIQEIFNKIIDYIEEN
jgi:hypothetical protein